MMPQGSWDFRDDEVWDDREVKGSVGDSLDSSLNLAAVVIGGVLAVLIVRLAL